MRYSARKAAKHKRVKNRVPKPRPDYNQSTWAIFIRDPDIRDPAAPAGKLFWRRFRVPYPRYEKLFQMRLDMGFKSESKDAFGRLGVPLQLKLLGILRVLGRATCFDGISELTMAHEETHRVFFHECCEKFASIYYQQYVYPPTTMEEMKKVSSVYERLGFPGYIGSVDCVNVISLKPLSAISLKPISFSLCMPHTINCSKYLYTNQLILYSFSLANGDTQASTLTATPIGQPWNDFKVCRYYRCFC